VLAPHRVNVTDGAGTTVFLTIAYDETRLPEDYRTRGVYADHIRLTERPQFKVQPALPSGVRAGVDILLASMQLDGSGNITSVDASGRQLASMAFRGDLVMESDRALRGKGRLRIEGDDRLHSTTIGSCSNERPILAGSVRITSPSCRTRDSSGSAQRVPKRSSMWTVAP